MKFIFFLLFGMFFILLGMMATISYAEPLPEKMKSSYSYFYMAIPFIFVFCGGICLINLSRTSIFIDFINLIK